MNNYGMNKIDFIRKQMSKDKIPLKCENCGYEWGYGGNNERATCPSCGNKTRVSRSRMDKKEQ